MSKTVLVTGASGYIGPHVCQAALAQGYEVRGTVLPTEKPEAAALVSKIPGLRIVEADLLDPASWDAAMKGVDAVIHLAHPGGHGMHGPEYTSSTGSASEYINTVVEGTANVLRAAARAGVRRVVTTGSTLPQYMGRDITEVNHQVLSEDHYIGLDSRAAVECASCAISAPGNSTSTPAASFLRCEQHRDEAIWGLARELDLDMTILLFGLALGPPLIQIDERNASIGPIKELMENKLLAVPDLNPPIVDVRDIALAQVNAIDCEETFGKRINVHHNQIGGMMDICSLIKRIFGSFGYKPPSVMLPNGMVHSLGLFVGSMANLSPMVGYHPKFDTSANLKMLKVQLRPMEQTVCDMGHVLIEMGIVERHRNYVKGLGPPALISRRPKSAGKSRTQKTEVCR